MKIQTRTVAVLLIWFVISSAAIAADAVRQAHDKPIGLIVAIQGQATATRLRQGSGGQAGVDGESRRLELKSPIFLNDKIVTEDNSKIQIMFEDDSFLSLGEKSEMTIDEYVYKPKDKEKANCSMKFLKGIFSVVTGQITDMNPERFKVRTRMATIGIRGCELGFSVREEKEDVYILQLPKGKSIVIQKIRTPDRALDSIWLSQVEVLNIVRAGVAVSIQEGLKLEERPITIDELRQIIEQSTLGLPSSDDGKQSFSSSGSASAKANAGVGGMKLREITDTVSAASATKAQADKSKEEEEKLQEEKESLSIFARPSDEDIGELPPKPDLPTEAPSAPYVPYGYPPFPGIGTDWEWGFFGDGSYSFSGNSLSAANYQAIVDGLTIYNLTGSGVAGAALYHDGIIKFVDGSCSLSMQVGSTASYEWDGTFDMDNSYGDSLAFGAKGSVGSGGVLSGQLDEGEVSYSLQVNGTTFTIGDVTTPESIGGKLVGPGTGLTPITGAVGDYEFQHGGAATVKGVFGADVSK